MIPWKSPLSTAAVVAVMLILGTPAAYTKPQIFQSSSFSTGQSNLSAASEASSTLNGVTSGECSYIDGQGRKVKIRFKETPNGSLTAETDAVHVTDPKVELQKCRVAAAKINQDLQENLQQHQALFQNQEKQFLKQQEAFRQQQDDIQKQSLQLQEQQVLHQAMLDELKRQHLYQQSLQDQLLRQQQDFHKWQSQLFSPFNPNR